MVRPDAQDCATLFHRPLIVLSCYSTVPLIGIIDYLTGSEFGMSPFYLIPVVITAWYGGRRHGLGIAATAAIAWLIADLMITEYSRTVIGYWNGLVRLILYGTIAGLVSHVRTLTAILQGQLVEKSKAFTSERARHGITRQQLQQREEQFRVLVEGVRNCAMFMLDINGLIISWNKGAETLTGYEGDEVLHQHFSLFEVSEVTQRLRADDAIVTAVEEGTFLQHAWLQRKDGSHYFAETMFTPLRNGEGRVDAFSMVVHDVTEQKILTDRLMAKEEDERFRIGQDLHDLLGQDLTAVAFLAEELAQQLKPSAESDALLAEKICRSARHAIDRVRQLARGLSPLSKEIGGLNTALQELTLAMEEIFGIRCQLYCSNAAHLLQQSMCRHLYRIAQEAIVNAVKHGKAEQVIVNLSATSSHYLLRIEDDGRGFTKVDRCPGMGIRIMKHRAEAMGGYLNVSRRRPRGTVVTCTVPLDAAGSSVESEEAACKPRS